MKTSTNANGPFSPGKDAQVDFAHFTNFMRRLVTVPHSEIKAQLDAEKKAKQKARAVVEKTKITDSLRIDICSSISSHLSAKSTGTVAINLIKFQLFSI